METIAISAPVASPAVQTAAQTTAGEGQVSFAQLLTGMTGTSNGGSQASATSTGEGLSWRETQAMRQMMGQMQQTDDGGLSLEALVTQLMGMLAQITEEDVAGALEGENAGAVFDQIDTIRRQMEQMLALGGQAGGAQQMTPQIGEDGAITLTLAQSDTLAQQMLNTEPSELLAKLTGLPAETIQKLLEAQQGSENQTGGQQAQTSGNAGDIPVAQVTTAKAGVQSGEATFQSNVQAARQLMEAEGTQQGTKTEVNIEELQRQVDEGVHFNNTSYTNAVQAEAKTGQAPAPILTQVQDGILKGIQQGEEQFSIKLVPEGLGELEVRLTKTVEGMLLSIVTKNAETQRILTADIDMLREQMRAYKVEVDSILTQQQDEFLNRQRSFEQQAWQNGRRPTAQNTRADAQAAIDPEALEAIAAAQTQLAAGALDTYI